MGVDQAGCREQATAFDHAVDRRSPVIVRVAMRAHRDDAPVGDADVSAFDETFLPVEGQDRDVSNQQ